MLRFRNNIVILLLLTCFFSLLTPITPAAAFSISDLIAPTTTANTGSSGSSLLNVLLGLLLGNLLGHTQNTDNKTLPTTDIKTLAITTGSGQALIDTAKKYLNVPYVWGGETPDGFDCSGFTQYVMKENHLTIPRTAAEQYATGINVEKPNLQTGDLVFFTTYKAGASHVGFYMNNGNFIHASSVAGKVTISSLNEAYYTEHYIGARRYTNQ